MLKADSVLIFTCGASDNGNLNSSREQFMQYAEKHITNYRFFKAESFFESFENSGDQDLLSIEEVLGDFSDCVLIFLESPGAYCELGAFAANNDMVSNILPVNKSEFQNADSFINGGPLKKIDSDSRFGKTIYTTFKTISRCFTEIEERLEKHLLRKRGKSTSLETIDDFESLTRKRRMLFISDLVSLLSPVRYRTIIDILEEIYGEHNDYNLKLEMNMLCATDMAERENGYYITTRPGESTFYKLNGSGFDFLSERTSVIRYYFKSDRKALKMLQKRAEYE